MTEPTTFEKTVYPTAEENRRMYMREYQRIQALKKKEAERIALERGDPIDETELLKRREYMREYKRKQYKENPDKENALQRTFRIKRSFNIPPEDFEKYKHYLGDIVRLKKIVERIPKELITKLFETENLHIPAPPPLKT